MPIEHKDEIELAVANLEAPAKGVRFIQIFKGTQVDRLRHHKAHI
ncbi:hypothetical protein [Cohaesibacter sp. ES.047]|nr:hypothetical protein [Cohaesibacter sp. ES.047]